MINKEERKIQKIIVTGGAGFIGSTLIKSLIKKGYEVLNIDKLTYAGNIDSLVEVSNSKNYSHECIDICNTELLNSIFLNFKPDCVMHLAAESHVDRSINVPFDFINTNIFGTFNLLEISKKYLQVSSKEKRENFVFHHISTDEVYGDLDDSDDLLFTEKTSYKPSSPYSASKAASDHLVRAWGRTYNLPIIVTNCSNNYGPNQFPEKLIPSTILNALQGRPLSVYGDGSQIRDWLYVEDHVEALIMVIKKGMPNETYNIGGNNEIKNIEVVRLICNLLEEFAPNKLLKVKKYNDLIKFVADRPGHDAHYAIDSSKIEKELGWLPKENLESGMRKTVKWYLENKEWWSRVIKGDYQNNNRFV